MYGEYAKYLVIVSIVVAFVWGLYRMVTYEEDDNERD
jgi:hypothetical protein